MWDCSPRHCLLFHMIPIEKRPDLCIFSPLIGKPHIDRQFFLKFRKYQCIRMGKYRIQMRFCQCIHRFPLFKQFKPCPVEVIPVIITFSHGRQVIVRKKCHRKPFPKAAPGLAEQSVPHSGFCLHPAYASDCLFCLSLLPRSLHQPFSTVISVFMSKKPTVFLSEITEMPTRSYNL